MRYDSAWITPMYAAARSFPISANSGRACSARPHACSPSVTSRRLSAALVRHRARSQAVQVPDRYRQDCEVLRGGLTGVTHLVAQCCARRLEFRESLGRELARFADCLLDRVPRLERQGCLAEHLRPCFEKVDQRVRSLPTGELAQLLAEHGGQPGRAPAEHLEGRSDAGTVGGGGKVLEARINHRAENFDDGRVVVSRHRCEVQPARDDRCAVAGVGGGVNRTAEAHHRLVRSPAHVMDLSQLAVGDVLVPAVGVRLVIQPHEFFRGNAGVLVEVLVGEDALPLGGDPQGEDRVLLGMGLGLVEPLVCGRPVVQVRRRPRAVVRRPSMQAGSLVVVRQRGNRINEGAGQEVALGVLAA